MTTPTPAAAAGSSPLVTALRGRAGGTAQPRKGSGRGQHREGAGQRGRPRPPGVRRAAGSWEAAGLASHRCPARGGSGPGRPNPGD